MIIDTIDNITILRSLSARFDQAVDWILNTDYAALEPGRHEIDGQNLYVNVQQNATICDGGRWEAHRKYADIQIVVSGCECMGYTAVRGLVTNQPYDGTKDIEFFAGDAANLCLVNSGMFAVFFPQDAHMPNIAVNNQSEVDKKLIVKVLL